MPSDPTPDIVATFGQAEPAADASDVFLELARIATARGQIPLKGTVWSCAIPDPEGRPIPRWLFTINATDADVADAIEGS